MNNKNKADITKIKNAYILKSLFSYLSSKQILKIVQKNKKLQNKLEISVENYKKYSGFPKYEYNEETDIERIPKRNHMMMGDCSQSCGQCISSCTSIIFILYLLVYSILQITLDTFDGSNTKENYDKSLENIINKLNKSLFILVGCVIVSWAALFFYVYIKCSYDYGFKKKLKSIIIITINIIHFTFEGLVIWKLVISYKILEGNLPWFMKMDYAFLSINFVHILFLILCTVFFFLESGDHIIISTTVTLHSFNNMEIDNYLLPDNFSDWKEKERKLFVLDKYNEFKFKYKGSRDFTNFVYIYINLQRQIKEIPALEIDSNSTIPDFILYEPAEIMLYPEKNIFKLSNNKFLFRYPDGQFENKVKIKDKEIFDILLKDNLNYIQKFVVSNVEYILVFGESSNTFNIKKLYKKKNNNKYYLNEDDNNIELKDSLLNEYV